MLVLQDDPLAIARSIVAFDIVRRSSEQSVSLVSLGLFALGAFVVGGWFYLFGLRVQGEEARIIARATQVSLPAVSVPPSYSQPPPIPVSTPTPIVIRVDVVPPATSTPSVQLRYFKLSFYDPAIGRYFPQVASVNCANWDSVNQQCLSVMSNGDTYLNWYGRGVACPPPLQLGDLVRVVYPPQLVGDWTCVDRGGAVVDGYLDFLLRYPDMVWTGYNLDNFPWSSTVQAYVNP